MSELKRYSEAMVSGNISCCIVIEKRHGLFGYSPDVVSVGLQAIDDNKDMGKAIDNYTGAAS